MKIIISRKGFDSQYGGYPSPILPDGRMVSIPIPRHSDRVTFHDLEIKGYGTSWDVMTKLGITGRLQTFNCHCDPDIYQERINRRPDGWREAFGQNEGDQTHLANQGVKEGDLFLFFGWYRETMETARGLSYVRDPDYRKGFHALFGYLQVGEKYNIGVKSYIPKWLASHPHCNIEGRQIRVPNNTVYVARDRLSFNEKYPGAGVFRFDKRLVLTKKGYSISRWGIPREVFGNATISHHNHDSWKEDYFQSVARGQEFVIADNEMVSEWAMKMIEIGI